MEQRAFVRVKVILPIKYFCDNKPFVGIVENLSENGMLIRSNKIKSYKGIIHVLIPLIEKDKKFHAKVRRVVKSNEDNCNICVEIINPPNSYLKFVSGLKSHYYMRNHPVF